MMTVRFPSGFSVQYNSAIRVQTDTGCQSLYSDVECKAFVARVPLDCIVEAVSPCRTYNANKIDAGAMLDEVIARVATDLRWQGYKLATLKKALEPFNAKTHKWRA